jgi:hypothetical protein
MSRHDGLACGEKFNGPWPEDFTRIYALNEDGTLCDFWFEGDGDQLSMEGAADLYAEENPGCKFVRITFASTGPVEDYIPEAED